MTKPEYAPTSEYHAALKSALVQIEAYKLQELASKRNTPINETAFNQLVSTIEGDYDLNANTLKFKNWGLRDNFEQLEDLQREAPFLFTPTESEKPVNDTVSLSDAEMRDMSSAELWLHVTADVDKL